MSLRLRSLQSSQRDIYQHDRRMERVRCDLRRRAELAATRQHELGRVLAAIRVIAQQGDPSR